MRAAALAWTLALLVALPASAQTETVVSTVQAGDAEEGRPFLPLPTQIVFIDSDRDGRLDHDDPVEPVYLDAHDDGVLNRGDVRLTDGFGAPGTSVRLGHGDFGLEVRLLSAWFASTARGDWFVDADASRTVSVGDVRLSGPDAGQRVGALDDDVGTATPSIQSDIDRNLRIGWTDPDQDGRVDPGEPILLDLERRTSDDDTVEAGDLRFPNRDPAPAQQDEGVTPSPAPAVVVDDGAGDDEDDEDEVEWGLVLAVVDLVAIAGLAYLVLRKKAE